MRCLSPTYSRFDEKLDFIGMAGCTCEITETEAAKGVWHPGTERSKCEKCLLRKKEGKQDGCLCKHEHPTLTEKAVCNDCGLINAKYATVTNVAAGQVIAQHFLYEWEYEENQSRVSPHTRFWSKKKRDYCGTCKESRGEDKMRRRFGAAPRTFRQGLERKIMKALSSAGGALPSEDVARRAAEESMHNWMGFETELVYSRRRQRPSHKYSETRDWFQFKWNP